MKSLFLTLLIIPGFVVAQQPSLRSEQLTQYCVNYATLAGMAYSLISSGTSPTKTFEIVSQRASQYEISDETAAYAVNRAMLTVQNKTLSQDQFIMFEAGYCTGRVECFLERRQ